MPDPQLPVLDATGRRWRRRHVHVPVAVWIAASVVAGAAIGAALEPGAEGDEVPATSEPFIAAACDDNYQGCVPVSSDVDCADGAGDALVTDADGPSFVTAPVEVVGDDVYGLDDDNNGIGCD